MSPTKLDDPRDGTPSDDPQLELWERYREALLFADDDESAGLLDELAATFGESHPDIRYERAANAWHLGGPATALPLLDALLRDVPDHSDAHHARGLAALEIAEEAGQEPSAAAKATMVEHFLTVLRLDAADFERARNDPDGHPHFDEDLEFITGVAEEVLAGLPEHFLEELQNVPVVLEEQPSEALVREGFDPRALGLFEGFEHGQKQQEGNVGLTRIVLFVANLLVDFPDRDQLAEEVEITMLHEIGHYFGLDEDGVEALGLA